MRVRPSFLIVATALVAFLAAQTAFGSPPPAPGPEVDFQPAAAVVEQQPRKPAGPKPYRMAVVRGQLALRDRPGGPAVGSVGATTEFGSRPVLGVAARRGRWLGVVTSARENGRLAWVRRAEVGLARTRWSLHADLSKHSLTLRRNGRVRLPDEFTRGYLTQLLQITKGNVSQAARLAKRNRTDFYALLGRHQLEPAAFKQDA